MVATRSSMRTAAPEAPEVPGQDGQAAEKVCTTSKGWAETHGVGDHSGAWGLTGAVGTALAYAGAVALMVGCPAFAIYLCAPQRRPMAEGRFGDATATCLLSPASAGALWKQDELHNGNHEHALAASGGRALVCKWSCVNAAAGVALASARRPWHPWANMPATHAKAVKAS